MQVQPPGRRILVYQRHGPGDDLVPVEEQLQRTIMRHDRQRPPVSSKIDT